MIVGGSGGGISVVAAVAAADIIRDGVPPGGGGQSAQKDRGDFWRNTRSRKAESEIRLVGKIMAAGNHEYA